MRAAGPVLTPTLTRHIMTLSVPIIGSRWNEGPPRDREAGPAWEDGMGILDAAGARS